MEEAIKLLVFDFITFISFLKKQPNVPKSWLSRIKRLELKCDNLGLTSKSASESPPVLNIPPHFVPDTPPTISTKSSTSHVICEEEYVANWDELSKGSGTPGDETPQKHLGPLDTKQPINQKWSLKPEECDRDLLMEQSLKIGKIYVKNFKKIISSTLGKRVEKTALLTNDFRFLLYKANKPKIDTVLDIRGALIQSNKLKNKRFTITSSSDKVETFEFETPDEAERDAWVYALFQASKGISFNNKNDLATADNTYQRVQETDNYNCIVEDDDDMDLDGDDSLIIYKSPPNGQPVDQGDYRLVDDDTDEDFEDDTEFDQEEIDLLPSPPSPLPHAESPDEFQDNYSYSSSNSSLSLCSPVDTSEFLNERPPSLPAKNQTPLKGPTDIPPKSKCLSKSLLGLSDEDISPPPAPELPPELPPKNRTTNGKTPNKKTPNRSGKRSSEPIVTPLMRDSHSPKTSSNNVSQTSGERLSQRSSLMSNNSAEDPLLSRLSSIDKRNDPPPIPEEASPKVKSKKKLSMPKKFFKNSNSSKSYDVTTPTSPEQNTRNPPPLRHSNIEEVTKELLAKVEERNKRLKLKPIEQTIGDIKSMSSPETKEIEFLGKKPSVVKVSPAGIKPQVLKPKPVLTKDHTIGKVSSPPSTGITDNSACQIPESPRTQYTKRKEKEKLEEVQKRIDSFQINDDESSEDNECLGEEEEDDW